MGKNAKIIIFSLIGLAVLGAVAAVLMLTAPKKEPDGGDDTITQTEDLNELMLCSRSDTDVRKLDITNSEGSYTITPDGADENGDPVFTIAEIASAPLNTDLLYNAVKYAAEFEAKEFVEEVSGDADLAKYGLDAPKATVTASFADGTEFSFRIGNDVPNTNTSAYMTADGKTVYTCYKSRTDCFSKSKFGYVSLAAMPSYDQASGEEVRRMTITRVGLDEPLIIENIAPEDEDSIQVYSYRLVSPYTAYADLADTPGFMYGLFGITASACEWVGMTESDYELAGLNEPNCTVTVESTVKTYTLTLGKAISETTTDENGNESSKITGFFGTSSEVPGVLYRFDVSSVASFHIEPDKLISRLFLMPYIFSLSGVSYSDAEGRSLDIGIEKIPAAEEGGEDQENFYIGGEKAKDAQPIKDLYQYFIGASGDELYFDEEKGDYLAEITYTYKDSSDGVGGKDVVRFYSSDADRKVIINLNGKNLFKTRYMYADQLFANIDRFNKGEEIVLSY